MKESPRTQNGDRTEGSDSRPKETEGQSSGPHALIVLMDQDIAQRGAKRHYCENVVSEVDLVESRQVQLESDLRKVLSAAGEKGKGVRRGGRGGDNSSSIKQESSYILGDRASFESKNPFGGKKKKERKRTLNNTN